MRIFGRKSGCDKLFFRVSTAFSRLLTLRVNAEQSASPGRTIYVTPVVNSRHRLSRVAPLALLGIPSTVLRLDVRKLRAGDQQHVNRCSFTWTAAVGAGRGGTGPLPPQEAAAAFAKTLQASRFGVVPSKVEVSAASR
jgi:hypothetical protein